MTGAAHAEPFARALRALRTYLDELVIAGAWAHRLFRFHEFARPPGYQPLMTVDADMATPANLRPRRQPIPRLLEISGFREKFKGQDARATTFYQLGDEDGAFYIEFIAPLTGSAIKRDRPDDIARVAGAIVPKLRWVDLLLEKTWTLQLEESLGFPVPANEQLIVQIANPLTYLIQKVLTLPRRATQQKREKDALYVYDTILIFSDGIESLRRQSPEVLALLPAKTIQEFERLCAKLFEPGGIVEGAAAIARSTGRGEPPASNLISLTCKEGLQRLFFA